MKARLYILLTQLFCLSLTISYAQVPRVIQNSFNETVRISKNDEIKSDSTDLGEDDKEEPDLRTEIPEDFTSSLDYLLNNWAVDKNIATNCKSYLNPVTQEDQYRKRLKKLPCLIEMPYNSAVKSFIEIFTQHRRKQVEYLLGLGDYYFPIFEEALDAQRLPLELKYLPIIESALNPRAVSKSGASGLWQFMIGTGKMYGLEVNTLVDERMDPVKSSKVAALLLKEYYSIFSDWNLALAAYNCGPGNVNKAIRRAGGKRDFWTIYPYLPAETRSYVPIYIAANYVMNYSEKHNLCPAKIRIPALTDTIMVNRRVHMAQIAAVLNIPIDELRLLNPQYRRDIIPGDIKPYPVCLPHNFANLFIDRRNEIYAYNANILVGNRRDEVEVLKPVYQKPSRHSSNSKTIYHKIKKGQNLSTIAKKYHITVAKLKKANGIEGSKIKPGQRLKIPQ
ncbi:MAG: lytic transglycosylase domain-containing protein [Paludibacteraceae bacterium]